MLTKRTRISVAQFLALQSTGELKLLCEKHDIQCEELDYGVDRFEAIRTIVVRTPEASLMSMLGRASALLEMYGMEYHRNIDLMSDGRICTDVLNLTAIKLICRNELSARLIPR